YAAGFFYGNTGTFTRWISATSAAIGTIAANALGHFPMGTSTGNYRPLWLRYSANLSGGSPGGTVSVLHNGTTGTAVASHNDASWNGGTIVEGVTNSNWVITPANGFAFTGSSGDIRFGGQGFGTNTLTDLDATLAASVVGTFAAATNANTTIEVNRTALTTAQLTNTWRIGTSYAFQSPLPIQLISFTAKPAGNKVNLNWTTLTETNNDYFTIERGKDATSFESIAVVDGAGNSISTLNYSHVDDEPYKGISYYRLKQTDFNGKFTYSNIIAVEFSNTDDPNFKVFPNPINGGENIYLLFSGNVGEEVIVVVFDVTGKESYSKVLVVQTVGDNVFAIDPTEKLSPGVYLIKATSNQNVYSKKLIIK
ncbi:MAG: T9SS type A sorting domain-containing protein, partial [Bacteroidetes bacterium]|nr:T9SS type A sorting domain-containing protein [Bacteroidota bacterium]